MNFLNFKKVNSTHDWARHLKDLAAMFLHFIYLPVPFHYIVYIISCRFYSLYVTQ